MTEPSAPAVDEEVAQRRLVDVVRDGHGELRELRQLAQNTELSRVGAVQRPVDQAQADVLTMRGLSGRVRCGVSSRRPG